MPDGLAEDIDNVITKELTLCRLYLIVKYLRASRRNRVKSLILMFFVLPSSKALTNRRT